MTPLATPAVSLSAAADRSGNFLFLGPHTAVLARLPRSGGSIADNWQLRLGGSAVSAVAAAASGDLFVAIAQSTTRLADRTQFCG